MMRGSSRLSAGIATRGRTTNGGRVVVGLLSPETPHQPLLRPAAFSQAGGRYRVTE